MAVAISGKLQLRGRSIFCNTDYTLYRDLFPTQVEQVS